MHMYIYLQYMYIYITYMYIHCVTCKENVLRACMSCDICKRSFEINTLTLDTCVEHVSSVRVRSVQERNAYSTRI